MLQIWTCGTSLFWARPWMPVSSTLIGCGLPVSQENIFPGLVTWEPLTRGLMNLEPLECSMQSYGAPQAWSIRYASWPLKAVMTCLGSHLLCACLWNRPDNRVANALIIFINWVIKIEHNLLTYSTKPFLFQDSCAQVENIFCQVKMNFSANAVEIFFTKSGHDFLPRK